MPHARGHLIRSCDCVRRPYVCPCPSLSGAPRPPTRLLAPHRNPTWPSAAPYPQMDQHRGHEQQHRIVLVHPSASRYRPRVNFHQRASLIQERARFLRFLRAESVAEHYRVQRMRCRWWLTRLWKCRPRAIGADVVWRGHVRSTSGWCVGHVVSAADLSCWHWQQYVRLFGVTNPHVEYMLCYCCHPYRVHDEVSSVQWMAGRS